MRDVVGELLSHLREHPLADHLYLFQWQTQVLAGCGKTPKLSFRGQVLPEESAFFLGFAQKQIPRFARNDNKTYFFRSLLGGRLHTPYTMEINFAYDNIAKAPTLLGTGPDLQPLDDKVSGAWTASAHTCPYQKVLSH